MRSALLTWLRSPAGGFLRGSRGQHPRLASTGCDPIQALPTRIVSLASATPAAGCASLSGVITRREVISQLRLTDCLYLDACRGGRSTAREMRHSKANGTRGKHLIEPLCVMRSQWLFASSGQVSTQQAPITRISASPATRAAGIGRHGIPTPVDDARAAPATCRHAPRRRTCQTARRRGTHVGTSPPTGGAPSAALAPAADGAARAGGRRGNARPLVF